jgi:hypothetical protein
MAPALEPETRVTVAYRLAEDNLDWEAVRGALFGLTISEKELRAHLGDLAELERYFGLIGSGEPEDGLFLISAAGNLILYVLPVPDPMVSADAVFVDAALRRLDRLEVLGEANLFLTTAAKHKAPRAVRAAA